MIVPLAFWVFLVGALGIAWQAGDRTDRKIILCIVGAAVFTHVSRFFLVGIERDIAVRLVDLVLLGIIIRYALVSPRFWPIWFAGMLACANLFGIVALFMPALEARTLLIASASWAIPCLLAVAIGLSLDRIKGDRGNSRISGLRGRNTISH